MDMSYPQQPGQQPPTNPGQPAQPGYPQPPTYQPTGGYPPPTAGYQPPQPNQAPAKRPWNVTLVAIIAFLIGLLDVAAGIGALLFRNEPRVQLEVGLSASNIAIYGGFLLVIGAVVLLLSFGLFGGSRMARGVIAFFAVLRIAFSVIGLVIATTMNTRTVFLVDIAISVLVLLMLFAGTRTKAFFARG